MTHSDTSDEVARPSGRRYGDVRKAQIRDHVDTLAPDIARWRALNRYYHDCDLDYLRFLIPEGKRILDLGCGTGATLAALRPTKGVGVDFSARTIDQANERFGDTHPELDFVVADFEAEDFADALDGQIFDVILLSDSIGFLEDCQSTLAGLRPLCTADTRIVIGSYSYLWEPVLQLAERLKLKMPQVVQNFLRQDDIENILGLAGFEVVKQEYRFLFPKKWLGIGPLLNKYVAALPFIRRLCLQSYTVARPAPASAVDTRPPAPSVSVVIPCRNEKGNIAEALSRLPAFCPDLEVVFVEGHSTDGTLAEIHRAIDDYEGPLKLSVLQQPGTGKGDAVRAGFDAATGDILMILDADLTVAPEDLPKFYDAIASGRGEFINGSRLIYPMEDQAMRFLNLIGNALFARLFSWLLNQRITDTLCGTKVMSRAHYRRIADGRAYFGALDPFGDFDLIFGATKLNLKFLEIPVRYASRGYGETQIDRFRHGLLLARMTAVAFRKLKAF